MTEKLTDDLGAFPSPNRLIHEPARLAITVLSSVRLLTSFSCTRRRGLAKETSPCNCLSKAGLVVITKEIIDKKMRTTVSLSKRGHSEIDEYGRSWTQSASAWREKNGDDRHK